MLDKNFPYRIATLCDLRDDRERILLIRRLQEPNFGLCSPIGGKLDIESGESPAQCAQREILEEAGIEVSIEDLRLVGLVSEQGYRNEAHWLLFIYRVMSPVHVEPKTIREGALEWHEPEAVASLPLPETDRKVIWPLLNEQHGRFCSVHIDCRGDEIRWTVEQRD